MPKILNEKAVIAIMREEWSKIKLAALTEVAVSHDGKPLLTPGLKVVDKKGNLFTILSVGNTGAVLEDPDGKTAVVPWETVEKDYKLQ